MRYLLLTFFLPSILIAETFLDCEFKAYTDEKGSKTTKERYKEEFPYLSIPANVSVIVNTNKKLVRFFPNNELYSQFLCCSYEDNYEGHNGKSDGTHHEVNYLESGNQISWRFILNPNYLPVTWRHVLNRHNGVLNIATNYWSMDYSCKKSNSLF